MRIIKTFLVMCFTGAACAFSADKVVLPDNPLLTKYPLVYVARNQFPPGHHNTETMFQSDLQNAQKYRTQQGSKLKTIDLKTGMVTVLVDPGPEGAVRDPEVSFDGTKIIFSMRKNIQDDYHIYEIEVDPSTGLMAGGTGLRQLTCLPKVFDIDPLYLPDGGIVFTSSREQKLCMCNIHIMGNLFRMDGDGANIHQIGKSTLHEGHSTLMPDGRIMYDRWEYVDRNFGDAQGLWVVNPDGTRHAIYWGNNTGSPGAVLDGRIIPETQLCIATLSSCHDRPWGAIGIIDRRLGVDGKEPILKTWPTSARDLVSVAGSFDAFTRVWPKYEDPYPLDRDNYLCSRQVTSGGRMGIFLLQTEGPEILLHREEAMDCFDPMPLGARFKPLARPVMRDYKNREGVFYVQDVYIGTHMDGINRGDVKYLRVVESPPKRNWTEPVWGGQGAHRPAMNWKDFANKRILGTVPVEQDGSAHFECPSDRFVFFQLLDENGMMLQSMRSGTIIQSGETQGCVGCHEDRVKDAPPMNLQPMALKRKPDKMKGWLNGDEIMSYQKHVQPVFNANCVKCHDYGKKAGEKLNLAGDRTLAFNASYIDLHSGNHVNCVGAGPAQILQPKIWGSHASKLIKVLREGHPAHKTVNLKKTELEMLITWIDLNGPYYPTYDSAYPDGVCGRAPIDDKQLKRLYELTRAPFVTGFGAGKKAQISFERPELSLCLGRLAKESAEYKEALGIIKAGAEQLKKVPRADMEAFVPCPKDMERNAKYAELLEIELKFREAIDSGRKIYDKDFINSYPHLKIGP